MSEETAQPQRSSPSKAELSWVAVNASPAELAGPLASETGLSPLTLRVCLQRGLATSEQIHAFLNPKLDQLTNPFEIAGMQQACDRLILARRQGERVRVFADYDVDGTTGAALLTWIFRELGFLFEVRQPDRFKDGYGLNLGAVEEAISDGVQVFITVDCGITSHDAIARAQQAGLDVLVVDHHQLDPVKGLPPALAVVNPQRPDCPSGLKMLCGCSLAFYLAVALRKASREEEWFKALPPINLKQHLDLVVMATAADMVPLVGDNHVLAKVGLEVLKHSKKPGVQALLRKAGLSSKDISPSHLGFVLGPRINASGRMQNANLAYELLTTEDESRAAELAEELERLNAERADVQNAIWDQVRLKVEAAIAEGRFKNAIVVADSDWHEGVVGIVASRVTESFKRPAAVISLREDFGKGSVRSYGGKDVLAALRESQEFLLRFGGHKFAAGLTVAPEHLASFAEAFDAAVGKLPLDRKAGTLLYEAHCQVEDLSARALGEIERLGPFGVGNPEPVFVIEGRPRDHRVLKGRHLKLNVGSPRSIEAIWFHAAERVDVMESLSDEEGPFFWAGVAELNRFNGRVTPTFRVKDWKRTLF